MYKFLFFMICFSIVSAGCSSIKTYPNNMTKNVFIKTNTESGSFFSSVKARLDIFDVDSKCETKYIGSVQLDRANQKVGLNKNKTSYLDFRFLSSGFLSSSSGSSGLNTLLKVRKGYIYDVVVSYEDNIYDVAIWEKRSKKARGREIEVAPLFDCKK